MDNCKDCVRVQNIEEDIKEMKDQIKSNTEDVSELKESQKETKVYIKMILEKIEYLTVGFENMRKEKEIEKTEELKELKQKKSDDEYNEGESWRLFAMDLLKFCIKFGVTFLIIMFSILMGWKIAEAMGLIKLITLGMV